METTGEVVLRKRFKCNQNTLDSARELAFYAASRKKQSAYVYVDDKGRWAWTLDLDKIIKGEVFQIMPDGIVFYTSNGVNMDKKPKTATAIKRDSSKFKKKILATDDAAIPF
jgi:hypothetical protein